VQNLGRFYTTSDFDREYFRKLVKISKSERHVIKNDSSRVRQNKFGELWSTNSKVGHVNLDSLKATFSGDYILALGVLGGWPLKFSHEVEIGQSLLAHTTHGEVGPPKIFKGEHLKLRLKFSV